MVWNGRSCQVSTAGIGERAQRRRELRRDQVDLGAGVEQRRHPPGRDRTAADDEHRRPASRRPSGYGVGSAHALSSLSGR